ncbi:RNI-like protein, partial [Clavulina sp. PMI_390]
MSLSIANYLPHEILVHIFKKLGSKADQHTCLLVSRAWCQCSVELLWHKLAVPNLAALLKLLHILSRKDQTFAYASFIRRLNLSAHTSHLTDEIVVRLVPCVRLERLTLGNCVTLSDASLAPLFSACPQLVAVDLNNVPNVTDESIIALATHSVHKLQGVNLTKCARITDEGILALARASPLLRRIKLHGLVLLTEESVVALAHGCPLLLELDLTNCDKLTDRAIREVWLHLHHLRELQLNHVTGLTDDAFPTRNSHPNPYTLSPAHPFDHLRLLDLTSCALLTDAALEGIITNAPRIRQLTLTRCSGLTDEALGSVGKLGRGLHFLHLGHVSNLTDLGVTRLVQSCPRLRYIDLANCSLLTDLSITSLTSLTKLRRVGLVRLPRLTDNALYALGEKNTGLERIHLSYCEALGVDAVGFLVARLGRLTHLSLTGVGSFRRKDLRAFCRLPPKDFNAHQRLAFCVYSGKGVSDLRKHL